MGKWKPEVGRMEAGSRKMEAEVGKWKPEVGKWKPEVGRMEAGSRKMEVGNWKMEEWNPNGPPYVTPPQRLVSVTSNATRPFATATDLCSL